MKVTPGHQFPIPAGDYAAQPLRARVAESPRDEPAIIDAAYTVVDPADLGGELVPPAAPESWSEALTAPLRTGAGSLHPTQAYSLAQRGLAGSAKGVHLDVVA